MKACHSSPTPPINTHVRLFDLVRFMRSELHDADLITDEEYAWLCMEAPLAKGDGSPSPRRLEDYDEIRARETKLHAALTAIRTNAMAHGNAETQLEIIMRLADEALA